MLPVGPPPPTQLNVPVTSVGVTRPVSVAAGVRIEMSVENEPSGFTDALNEFGPTPLPTYVGHWLMVLRPGLATKSHRVGPGAGAGAGAGVGELAVPVGGSLVVSPLPA